MKKVTLKFSEEQYAALDTHRKSTKRRSQHPTNPEAFIEEPIHADVPAMILAAVMQQYAPVIFSVVPAEAATLIRESEEKKKQANDVLNSTITVTVEDGAN